MIDELSMEMVQKCYIEQQADITNTNQSEETRKQQIQN